MIGFALLFDALVLAGAVWFCMVHERQHDRERTRWHEERRQLLDRIMARDYAEYWAGQPQTRPASPRQLLTDADIAAYHLAHGAGKADPYGA